MDSYGLYGQIWTNMDKYGQKWTKMDKNKFYFAEIKKQLYNYSLTKQVGHGELDS